MSVTVTSVTDKVQLFSLAILRSSSVQPISLGVAFLLTADLIKPVLVIVGFKSSFRGVIVYLHRLYSLKTVGDAKYSSDILRARFSIAIINLA